jgi:hypothetical protein
MAKSTRAVGASFTEEELSDPVTPAVIQRAMLGGDVQSLGDSSKPSSQSEEESKPVQQEGPPSPVHTTENPSGQNKETEQPDSTASSTGGSGPKTGTASRKRPAGRGTRNASSRSTDDFDDFD